MRAHFVVYSILSLCACTAEDRRGAPPALAFDSAPPLSVVDSATTDATASPDTSKASPEAAVDSAAVVDTAMAGEPDIGAPPDVTVIDRCSGPYAAFTTKGLIAGGMTPKAFATAYNSEVAALKTPGPMLLAFKGIDTADSTRWKLKIGGVDLIGSGPDVKFFGPTAEVNYVLKTGVTLEVPEQLASFKLRFATEIPVHAMKMSATAGDCTEISVDQLILLIPDSARDLPFGGSTVGALMGPAIPADGGPSGWVLELLGSDKRATIGGGGP